MSSSHCPAGSVSQWLKDRGIDSEKDYRWSDIRGADKQLERAKKDRFELALRLANLWSDKGQSKYTTPGHAEVLSHINDQNFGLYIYDKGLPTLDVYFICNKQEEFVSFGIANERITFKEAIEATNNIKFIMARPSAEREGAGKAAVKEGLMRSFEAGLPGICLSPADLNSGNFYRYLQFKNVRHKSGYEPLCLNISDSAQKFKDVHSAVTQSFSELQQGQTGSESSLAPQVFKDMWRERFNLEIPIDQRVNF